MVLTFMSCSTRTFNLNSGGSDVAAVDKMQSFFVYGIGQEQTLNASTICGGSDKIIKVQTETTFLNGLLAALSYNIYAPRQVRVYCKK